MKSDGKRDENYINVYTKVFLLTYLQSITKTFVLPKVQQI